MEKGKFVARIATLTFCLITACAKPNLTNVADGVVKTMNGFSDSLTSTFKGGYTLEEARRCQEQTFKFEKLDLPTKATVNIYLNPQSFSLYTDEHAIMDFGPPTWYTINLKTRKLTTYTRSWGSWDKGVETSLPPAENEKFISTLDFNKVKQTLDISNPFILSRARLGVRMGFAVPGSAKETNRLCSPKPRPML